MMVAIQRSFLARMNALGDTPSEVAGSLSAVPELPPAARLSRWLALAEAKSFRSRVTPRRTLCWWDTVPGSRFAVSNPPAVRLFLSGRG